MTWREASYDILTILKARYDDSPITLAHIVYWLRIYGDRLLILHQKKRDSGAYLSEFEILPSFIHTDAGGRKYFDLPQEIFDYDQDKGIEYISYMPDGFKYTTFSRTTRAAARRLLWTEEENPTPSNPYFYRIKGRIYLLGVECIHVPSLDVGLRTTLNGLEPCDLDEVMPFPGELIPILQRQVIDLGRFVLMIPKDRANTGDSLDDLNQEIPKTKLVSAAEMTNPQEAQ